MKKLTGEAKAAASGAESEPHNRLPDDRVNRRTESLRRMQAEEDEENAAFAKWLEHGSDDLHEAWVSVCPVAKDHSVMSFRLTRIIEHIRTGGPVKVFTYGRERDIDLRQKHADIARLYRKGVEQAAQINRLTLKKLISALRLEAEVDDVTPVTTQPNKKEKKFIITAIKIGQEELPAPDGYVYKRPDDLGKQLAAEAKKDVPAAMFAGFFKPERNADNMVQSTGLFTLDFDHVDDLDRVSELIRKDPNVFLCFVSITGSGLKVCVHGPATRNRVEYSAAYVRIAEAKAKKWGLRAEIDRPTKDCSRLCFLSYDPELYVNWDAVPVSLDDMPECNSDPVDAKVAKNVESSAKVERAQVDRTAAPSGIPLTIDWTEAGAIPDTKWEKIPLSRCLDAMRFIDSCCDREQWRIVGAALKLGYGDDAFNHFDHWSSLGGSQYEGREACWRMWQSHKRSATGESVVTPKSILRLARGNGWKPASERPDIRSDNPSVVGDELDERGRIVLPLFGTEIPAGEFSGHIFDHMAKCGEAYIRGGQVCRLVDDPQQGLVIEGVSPAAMVTWIEEFASLYIRDRNGERQTTSISERSCRVVLAAEHRYRLPPLDSVVEAPILCEIDGGVQYIETGYNRKLAAFVSGRLVMPDVQSTDEARTNIMSMLKDYEFATPSDKSRAVAAILTPAFKRGRFVKGHAPMSLFEADESQSGKSLLALAIPAAYGERADLISRREKGVGSLDESIAEAMLKGRQFIVVDNVRGDLDSQFLECVLTGSGRVSVRAPHKGNVSVDADRYTFAVTSNGMSATRDLCNRVSLVRIVKRPGYSFPIFPEGSLPAHVLANCGLYLASIYMVIAEWLNRGKPRTQEARHSFIEWAGTLDWVVQNIFGLPRLLDGHAETLRRVEHPDLALFRQLCLELGKRGKLDRTIRASELAEVASEAHIDLGRRATAIIDGAAMAMGKVMANSFAALGTNSNDTIEFEGYFIRRRKERYRRSDDMGTKEAWAYQFARQPFEGDWDIADDALRLAPPLLAPDSTRSTRPDE